jgi:hypothetical protein
MHSFAGDSLFLKLRARNDDFKFQRGHVNFSGVNVIGEIVSAWSMTPLK